MKKLLPELNIVNFNSHIADYKAFSFVDGYGVRCSLYLSGCTHKCPSCFNEAAWDFTYGEAYSLALEERILQDLAQSFVQGLTLLGGEPFLNLPTCLTLVKKVREKFADKKDIWIYSGFTFEEILKDEKKFALLKEADILVDGKFVLALKDENLAFRGSSNQRIIDIKKSLQEKKIFLWQA